MAPYNLLFCVIINSIKITWGQNMQKLILRVEIISDRTTELTVSLGQFYLKQADKQTHS